MDEQPPRKELINLTNFKERMLICLHSFQWNSTAPHWCVSCGAALHSEYNDNSRIS